MNAIFSDNKLKLGLFGTNGGATLSRVPEVWRPRWDAIRETAIIADRAGLEAQLGYARWKGFIPGKPEQGPGIVMDSFTWAAGLSQVTQYSTLIATTHAATIHPVTAAKQTATIDLMSNGRFALNVVGGWNKLELDMFGEPLKAHDSRYDELEEWTTILTRLWTEKEEFDFQGDYFTIVEGMSRPQPFQEPHPPIINAGSSPRGLAFAAKHADICFIVPATETLEGAKEKVDEYKDAARAHGHEVQVWTYCAVSQRDTREEAEQYLRYFTEEMQDVELVDAWTASALASAGDHISADLLRYYRQRFAAGSGGPILVGTASDIADQMQELHQVGIDGILLTWPDFLDGVKRLVAPGSVLTELEKRGLRQPFPGVEG